MPCRAAEWSVTSSTSGWFSGFGQCSGKALHFLGIAERLAQTNRGGHMRRWYPMAVSAASLMVGIMSSPYIGKGISRLTKALGWPSDGLSFIALWAIASLLLCILVFLVVLPVVSLVAWLAVGRREQKREQQRLEGRRKQLGKLLNTAEDILSQLNMMADEFRRETLFDQAAEERLTEAVAKADMVIRRAVTCAVQGGTQVFAPEVDALFNSIISHSSAEIVSPLSPTVPPSRAQTKRKVSKSTWGVSCVRLLTHQVHESVRNHPLLKNRPVP